MATATTSEPGAKGPKLNRLGLPQSDYRGAPSTLCAGCGHDAVTSQIVKAIWEMGIDPGLQKDGVEAPKKRRRTGMAKRESQEKVGRRSAVQPIDLATAALMAAFALRSAMRLIGG